MKTIVSLKYFVNGGSKGDDYTTGCLLDYHYFKKHKMIAIDLSKQQALDADPKARNNLILLEIKMVQIIEQCFSLL